MDNAPILRFLRVTLTSTPMTTPRLLLAALLLGASFTAGCNSANTAATMPEPGFVSLFNGTDLTGWQYRTGEKFDGKTATGDTRFSVGNGMFVVHGTEAGGRTAQIWTTRQFPKDFVLRLQFRSAVNADSGIFIRSPQLQCRDYLVAGPYKALTKYRAQDWNDIEITVTGGVARCTYNGEVLEAALKVPTTGGIGLELDRGQMEYRNIRVKELP